MDKNGKIEVIFLVLIRAHFPEMIRTASSMRKRARVNPTIVFLGNEDFSEEYKRCEFFDVSYRANGAEKDLGPKSFSLQNRAIVSDGKNQIIDLKQRIKNSLFGKFLKWIFNYYVRCFVTKDSLFCLPWHLVRLKKLSRLTWNLLSLIKADVVILPHIEIRGMLGQIAWVAQKKKIPVIVVPYAWILRQELLSVLADKPVYQVRGLVNRFVSRFFPQWEYNLYLGASAVEILAMEFLKLPTSNPWMSDDLADALALESEAMLKSYTADGVRSERCHVTGSAALDILASYKVQESGLSVLTENGEEKIQGQYAVAFLPPDQTGNRINGFEFFNYWEMLTFYIQTLIPKSSIPIVFSLHPRDSSLKERLLQEFPKMKIYDGDACNIIPGAEYCVGTLSGMLRYVVSSAKPLLYYDVYQYCMNEYADVSSVVAVTSKLEFNNQVVKFNDDREYFSGLSKIAKVNAANWGRLDGNAVGRIESLIETQFSLKES
ncbi:hypothetical protein EFP84_17970 [Leptospira kmetyi]|uniref:Uncharacterized protein n=1 Tax=Leptospira kmetyi TaxID=408139 RepID=A0AAD0UT97_9LEPT|nr:hypothetical protein [Leptospira kmetyi]AYV57210.1 hypothetical protein EFP84_17970 [Leptospira kmetyi]